jgi:hypothetical protein
LQERTYFGEQIRPTTYTEEYGDEISVITDDNSGRELVQVAIHPEDARELVNILRYRLNASY